MVRYTQRVIQAEIPIATYDYGGAGRDVVLLHGGGRTLGDLAAVVVGLALDNPVVIGHSLGGMIAAMWAYENPQCPLAMNIDGHGNPSRPDQYAGLDGDAAAGAHAAMMDYFAPLIAELPEMLRAVLRQIAGTDLFGVYRACACPLMVVSCTGTGLRDMLPEKLQPAWEAYMTWVRQQLTDAAEASTSLSLAWMPTGHDAHLERPEAVVHLIASRALAA